MMKKERSELILMKTWQYIFQFVVRDEKVREDTRCS